MSDRPERRFRKDFGALPGIFQFVAERLETLGIRGDEGPWVDLVVEELFTNTVKYAPNGGEVVIEIEREADRLRVRITDFDVDEFDLTKNARPVDVDLPLAERKPGGLGLYFVRETSESITYEYRDRNSIVTVTKTLGS